MKTAVKIGLGIAAVAAAFMAWKKMRGSKSPASVFQSTSGKILSEQPGQLPPDFSESGYLSINTDVDAAIKKWFLVWHRRPTLFGNRMERRTGMENWNGWHVAFIKIEIEFSILNLIYGRKFAFTLLRVFQRATRGH